MNKCLKISFPKTKLPQDFLRSVIQKNAKSLEIEGTVQVFPAENRISIIACGLKDNVDTFLDLSDIVLTNKE